MSPFPWLRPSVLALGVWLAAAGHARADSRPAPPRHGPASPPAQPAGAPDAFPSYIAPPRGITAVPAAPAPDLDPCPPRTRHVGPGRAERHRIASDCRDD